MAGLKANQVVVDVVAVAYKLIPPAEPASETPVRLQPSVPEPSQIGPRSCPLGHEQPQGVRFCGMCGMDMSAPPPGQVNMETARPKPEGQLTPAERAERDRQHMEALSLASRVEQAPVTYEEYEPKPGETVVIHFLEDGFTVFGQVWYRGQELELGPNHPRWSEAKGWILLNKWQQYDRYGKQFFDQGPWPGRRSYRAPDVQFEQLSTLDKKNKFAGPTAEELARAEEAERRRGRAVPAPVFR